MPDLSRDKLVVATHNLGKREELRAFLSPHVAEIVSAGELGLAEPEETGSTFYDNALIKAQAAAAASGLPSLGDDSGLCVTALGGGPGVLSGRWARSAPTLHEALKSIHEAIGEDPDRSAYFVCSLALVWPGGESLCVEERCDGQIVWPPRGSGGHGYDPIFQPAGETRTFAEMTAEEKDRLSHRGKALRALAALFDQK